MAAAVRAGGPRGEFSSSDGDDRDSVLSGSNLSFTTELQNRLKEVENEKLSLMINHNNLIKEFNKRMESHLEEIHVLKTSNHGMISEMQELRDLCCYLDDDRQKCRKLAKEWQRFGKYTVTVMRNEVMSYQEKLSTLEGRQVELIKENGELRDICVYLDNSRLGDASENEEEIKQSIFKYSICEKCKILRSPKSDAWSNGDDVDKLSGFPVGKHDGDLATYTKQLEDNIRLLEEDKDQLRAALSNKKAKKRVSFLFPDDDGDSSTSEQDRYDMFQNGHHRPYDGRDIANGNHGVHGILRNGFNVKQKEIPHPPISPDSLAFADNSTQAMRVLEIQEKLERASIDSGSTETLSENETAILKEMCNVVWKKLADDKSPTSPPPYQKPALLQERSGSSSAPSQESTVPKKVLEDLC